jgi:flagellar protein FliL
VTSAAITADIVEAAESNASSLPPASKRKKLLILGAIIALLAVAGGGIWWWFSGASAEPGKAEPASAEELVDVPPMTVNLRSADGSTHLLKVHVMLVPGKTDKETITARLPVVLDGLQPFLRELRPEDVTGAAATFRIKEEMLLRANAAIGADAVRDVLIQDLVQQ